MALELITGHTGAAHVSAADDAGIVGTILGDDMRPFVSTDGGKLITGDIEVIESSITQSGSGTNVSLVIPIKLAPFYQTLPDGGVLHLDDSAIVQAYSPAYTRGVSASQSFIVDIYIDNYSTPTLKAACGALGGYDDDPAPTPPTISGTALRRIKITATGLSASSSDIVGWSKAAPDCLPTADSAIDWLTIDRSDPSDPPYQYGTNLVTIFDQNRIDASQGGGIAVASAWKAYTPSTGKIAARPSSIDLGNVEAHVWCRGYYGDDTTQIDADEGGIFTLTGYAEFDAGSGASNIKLSPTGNDNTSWAFVVPDPFHFASRRGMSMQILNGASYAIVGGTSMKSNLSDYFGPTSLLQVDLHLVHTSGGWQLVAYIPLTPGAGTMSIFQIKLFLMADALIHPCSAGDIPTYASELPIDDGTA